MKSVRPVQPLKADVPMLVTPSSSTSPVTPVPQGTGLYSGSKYHISPVPEMVSTPLSSSVQVRSSPQALAEYVKLMFALVRLSLPELMLIASQ